MPPTCKKCGVALAAKETTKQPSWLSRLSDPTWCPACAQNYHQAISFAAFLIIPTVIFVEALFVGCDDPAWWGLINLYLTLWAWMLCIPFHELGHAFAARLIGWKVERIVWGKGRELAKFRFLGFSWELHLILRSGGAAIATLSPTVPTIANYAFFTLAGPLANFLLAALVIPFAHDGLPWNLVPMTHGFDFLRAFFWGNIFMGANALIPRTYHGVTGRVDSDGLKLWKICTQPQTVLKRLRAGNFRHQIAAKYNAGFLPEARALVDQALAENPNNKPFLSFRNSLALETGDIEAAHQGLLAFSERSDLTLEEKGLSCNNLAYIYAILGDTDSLAKADTLSQQALVALPDQTYAIGTRGSVLIALGRYAEGEEIILSSQPKVENPHGQAQNMCWLALAAGQQGRLDEARQHLAEARRIQATCFLLPRVEQALASILNSSNPPGASP